MTFSPRLLALLLLTLLASLRPAAAVLVEFTGQGSVVGTSGTPPPSIYVEADRSTQLTVTGVFDSEQPAIERSEDGATYAALYAVGAVDGVERPLQRATLKIRRDLTFGYHEYVLSGSTAEGWTFTLYGYSDDARFVPSFELPQARPPEGDWYYKWDVDVIGPNWEWSGYSDGALHDVQVIEEPMEPADSPVITRQPASRSARAGSTVNLKVAVHSVAPLTYQWYQNNQPIPGATGRKLKLKHVHAADAGAYHVEISNGLSVARSDVAQVQVRW